MHRRWLLLLSVFLVGGVAMAPAQSATHLFGAGFPGDVTAGASPALAPALTKEAVARELRRVLSAQPRPPKADRHVLRARLALSGAGTIAPLLFIAFEGTGAFEPRLAPALLSLRKFGAIPLDFHVDSLAADAYRDVFGRKAKWSALRSGAMCQLLADPGLTPGGFHWMSFPSEELEVLAGEDQAKKVSNYGKILENAITSTAGVPRGMNEAVTATEAYLARAALAGVRPKLVILSHSSGGRTAVKFMEKLRRIRDPRTGAAPIRAQLVMTIDPVREAHEAVSELLADVALKAGTGRLPLVAHRPQPESLYKTGNTDKWVSVYQRVDSLGMKVDSLPKHGIHGSPIVGADLEEEITFTDTDQAESGHGSVGYAPRTVEIFRAELAAVAATGLPVAAASPRPNPAALAQSFYKTYLKVPHRDWLAAPFFSDVDEANNFIEAMVAGAGQDPAGYEAFRARVRRFEENGQPVADWFRSSWNKYLRLFRAEHRGGSRRGIQVGRSLWGGRTFKIEDRDADSWKREAEANMKKLSEAMKLAF